MEKKVKYEVEINLEKGNTYISCDILTAPHNHKQVWTEETFLPMILSMEQYYGYKYNNPEGELLYL